MKNVIAVLALSGLAVSAASAQVNTFTLNDGLFRYSVGAVNGGATARTGTGAGLSTNFGLASGTGALVTADQLYQHHFWYRSAGDTREFALSNMTASFALGGNSIFNRYVEPIGGSTTAGTLTFELTYTLNQITSTSAAVTINWSIVNNSNSSQTVNFFSYADKPNHEVGMYFKARLRPQSPFLNQSRTHWGAEGTRRLEFQWFACDQLPQVDLRPTFLQQALNKPVLQFAHVVQRDSGSVA